MILCGEVGGGVGRWGVDDSVEVRSSHDLGWFVVYHGTCTCTFRTRVSKLDCKVCVGPAERRKRVRFPCELRSEQCATILHSRDRVRHQGGPRLISRSVGAPPLVWGGWAPLNIKQEQCTYFGVFGY